MKNPNHSKNIEITGSAGRIFIACVKEEVVCDVIFLDCDADIFEERIIYNSNNHVILDYEDRLHQNVLYPQFEYFKFKT
jgi:hypothetical protein